MFRRKKKEYNWKVIERVNKMTDEEILANKKKLYIESGITTVGGLLLVIVGIVLIIVLF